MKNILFLITMLFASANMSAQVDWKFQVTKFVDDAGSPTPAVNSHYVWNQQSNRQQGIRINLKPSAEATLYVEANNSKFRFHHSEGEDSQSNKLHHLSVSINGGPYVELYDVNIFNSTKNIYWTSSSYFPSAGEYTLTVRFKRSVGFVMYERFRDYIVKVVPKSDELHMDQYKNTMRVWKSNYSNARPFLLSVGLDAHNVLPEQFQRDNVKSLFDCLLNDPSNPHDIYVLYYRYNPQDLRNNAAVFASAVNYVSTSDYGGKKIVAGGRSMGGIISRYAVAKAEDVGNPLPVLTWFTLDSPHDGANVSAPVLDFFESVDWATGTFLRKNNDNPAAKIMLKYNPYDPNGVMRNSFYNELDDLNGDGFPHLSHNIGISFGNSSPNPNSGTWVSINLIGLSLINFPMTAEDRKAGSLLPRRDIGGFGDVLTINQAKDPTFMSYKSALDIDDNDNNDTNDLANSRFDAHVAPDETYHHDVFPSEIATDLAKEIVAPENLFFQDVNMNGKAEYRAYDEIYAGGNVRADRANGAVNVDAEEIIFKAGEGIVLKSDFVVKSGTNFVAKIGATATPNCWQYEFAGGHGDTRNDFGERDQLQENAVAINSLKVYPNPIENLTTLDFVIAESGNVLIQLINGQGQVIRTLLESNEMTLGQHQLELSLQDLPKGVYFLQFLVGKTQLHEKVVKL